MNWNLFDYLIAGLLLLFAIAGGIAALTLARGTWHRAGLVLAGLGAIALFWANGAVGIIGSEANDANAAFLVLFAIGALGAVLSHFRAGGLMWTLLAMAAAQVAIGAAAWAFGWGADGAAWPRDIAAATAVFTLIWLAAAGCFLFARRTRS